MGRSQGPAFLVLPLLLLPIAFRMHAQVTSAYLQGVMSPTFLPDLLPPIPSLTLCPGLCCWLQPRLQRIPRYLDIHFIA